MRKSLSLALLLSTALATAAFAAPQPAADAFVRSLAKSASCSTSLPAFLSLQAPAPQERTGGCYQADCYSDLDCPCGNGYGICGINNTCYYPPSGSGGGGGLGCPMAECTDDSQCLLNCKDGLHSFCTMSGTCVYVP